MKNYCIILKWADDKKIFTEQELFDKFPELNSKLRNWYLNIFRGNEGCLFSICDFKNNIHYYCLTEKGLSHLSSCAAEDKTSVKNIEIIRGDKIKQCGKHNKFVINRINGKKESFCNKFLWKFIIPILVVVVGACVIYYMGFK